MGINPRIFGKMDKLESRIFELEVKTMTIFGEKMKY